MAAAKSAPVELTYEQRKAIATAPGWIAQVGDKIMGATVIGLSMHEHPEYGLSPKLTYQQTDGSYISVYAFHQVLRDRLKELGTKIGSVQNLERLADETSRSRVNSDGDPQRYVNYYVENAGTTMQEVSDNFAF